MDKKTFYESLWTFVALFAFFIMLGLLIDYVSVHTFKSEWHTYVAWLLSALGTLLLLFLKIKTTKKEKHFEKIENMIEMKADRTYVDEKFETAKMYIDDHKENDDKHNEMIHEFMTSIDARLKDVTDYIMNKKK